MRFLLLLAVLFLALALICLVSPTLILGGGWATWTVAGLLAWALDALLGGYPLVLPGRRPSAP